MKVTISASVRRWIIKPRVPGFAENARYRNRTAGPVRFAFLLLSLLASTPSSASAESDLSVYRISPWVDGSIIVATSLGSIFPALNQDNLIRPRCPCDLGEVNALDRHVIGNNSEAAEIVSDATLGLALAAPPLLDLYALGPSRPLAEDLTVYAEVLSVSGAFVTLAKYTVQRPIPRVYAGQASPNDPGNYRSFYSGHTALTFSALSAAAITTNLRYDFGAWPWVVTGVVGLTVAETRVLAGQHFYTDVAMGTVAGALAGITIPLLHKLDSPKQTVALSRTTDGLELTFSRRF
jgi:membrane-associated phospholipid phosphatase